VYVRHLSVVDFRSWPTAELDLEPGPSVLVGANGQGKTNLVEALAYLATLGSHRVASDAPLIRAGADRALVRAAAVAGGRELRVEVEIVPGRANRARLNGSPVSRARDILGAVRTVVFAPEDLAIVRGDPSERRTFLDELVVARMPRLAGVRSDYERVLKQRAVLLKSAGGARKADLPTLDVWDGHLATFGAQLLRARLDAVAALRPFAVSVYGEVAPTSADLTLRYASGLPELAGQDDSAADVAALEAALLAELARRRPQELDRGVNLVGPHRDDLEIGIGDLPVRGYASHGEGWSVALALRLAAFELLRTEYGPGGEPILVLDDVFAELDADRRAQLAIAAGKAEQVLITAAVGGDVPDQLDGARFAVAGGSVRRVR
jgi:DNA replication and repair protein RecF